MRRLILTPETVVRMVEKAFQMELSIGPRGGHRTGWHIDPKTGRKVYDYGERKPSSGRSRTQEAAAPRPAKPQQMGLFGERAPKTEPHATASNRAEPEAVAPRLEPARPRQSSLLEGYRGAVAKVPRKVASAEVGEHVWGSRADKWRASVSEDDLRTMTPEQAHKVVTKANLLPPLDLEQEQAAGVTPHAAALKKVIIDAIHSRAPDSDEGRRQYMRGVDLVARSLPGCKTAADVRQLRRDFHDLREGVYRVDPSENFATASEARAAWDADDAQPADGGFASVRQSVDGTQYFRVWIGGKSQDAYKAMFRALGRRFESLVRSREDVSSGSDWYKAHRGIGLTVAEWDDPAVTAHFGKKTARATSAKRPFKWTRAVTAKPERVGGPPVRGVVTPKALADTFGLKNVQFGNWLSEDDAKQHLRDANAALADLADICGIPLETVSGYGKLSIGFGARGGGRSTAHYEPVGTIINITKFAGGGSLAHEWAHFVDNAIAKAMRGPGSTSGASVFMSDDKHRGTAIGDAFRATMKAIYEGAPDADKAPPVTREMAKDTYREIEQIVIKMRDARKDPEAYADLNRQYNEKVRLYKEQAQEAAKPGSGRKSFFLRDAESMSPDATDSYWTRPHELFARAFEAWAQDQLEDNGRRNSYLVDGTREPYETMRRRKDGSMAQIYPMGSERAYINKAITELVSTLAKEKALEKALDALGFVPGERPRAFGRRAPVEWAEKSADAALVTAPVSPRRIRVEAPTKDRRTYPFQGFLDFQGFKIDIENKAGSVRRGVGRDGKPWRTMMHYPYGEIRDTEGKDGDRLDVYVGPLADSPLVVVVHQQDPDTQRYDEDKVMLGFATEDEALAAYAGQYDRPGYYQDHTTMGIGEFWRWVHDGRKRGRKIRGEA